MSGQSGTGVQDLRVGVCKTPTGYHCTICSIDCTGIKNLEDHVRGKKHQKKAKAKALAAATGFASNQPLPVEGYQQQYPTHKRPYSEITPSPSWEPATQVGLPVLPSSFAESPPHKRQRTNTFPESFAPHFGGLLPLTASSPAPLTQELNSSFLLPISAPSLPPPEPSPPPPIPPQTLPVPAKLSNPTYPRAKPAPPPASSSHAITQPNVPIKGTFCCSLCQVVLPENALYAHFAGKRHQKSLMRATGAINGIRRHPAYDPTAAPFVAAAEAAAAVSPSAASLNDGDTILTVRSAELQPSTASTQAMASLLRAVMYCLRTSIKPTTAAGEPTTREDIIADLVVVGSYAKGVQLKDQNIVDLVVILRDPPIQRTTAQLLAKRLMTIPEVTVEPLDWELFVSTSRRSEILVSVAVRLAFQRKGRNTKTADGVVVPPEFVSLNRHALAAIRHVKWFEQIARTAPTVVPAVRLIRHFLRKRSMYNALSTWAVEVLVGQVCTAGPTQTHLAMAIRSVFECISAGCLLPGGVGIIDPVRLTTPGPSSKPHAPSDPVPAPIIPRQDEVNGLTITLGMRTDGIQQSEAQQSTAEEDLVDLASALTPSERDHLTALAQEALRKVAFGKWDEVFA